MSNLSYENPLNRKKLETYEWDNIWMEHAEKDGITRVLYIGDSISCGTRGVATRLSEGKAYFDGFGTSKAVDNPYFCDSVRIFAEQEGYRSAVIFNNGLHGWHLDDEKEYPGYYGKTVEFFIELFKPTPLFLVLTTSVADKKQDLRVRKRNEAVKIIAEKYGLETIDFYSPAASDPSLLSGDGVHFTGNGYEVLAKTALDALKDIIK